MGNFKLIHSYQKTDSPFPEITSNSTIILENKLYELNKPIRIVGMKNIIIDGHGAQISANSLVSDVMYIEDSENITLKNFHATHLEPSGPLGCTGNVIHIERSNNITIESCDLNGSGIVGVAAYFVNDLKIKNSHIHENSEYGIIFQGKSIELEKNTFDNNSSGHLYYSYLESESDYTWPPKMLIDQNENIQGLRMKGNIFIKTNSPEATPPPPENIISDFQFPWEMTVMILPLEVIRHHTKKELTVDFYNNVTIENEFEFSFEIEGFNVVIVKVGNVSSSQYRNGELYRIDKHTEYKGGVDFQMFWMIKLENTLILLPQISDGSIGTVENERFEIAMDMEGVLNTELFDGVEKVIDDNEAYISSLDYRSTVPITSSTHLNLIERSVEYNDIIKFKNLLNPISMGLITDTVYIEKTKAPSFRASPEDQTYVDPYLHNKEGGIWMFQPDGLVLCYSYDFKDALETAMPISKDYRTYNRYDCMDMPHQIAKVVDMEDINLNDLSQKHMIDDSLFLYEINNDSSQILKNSYEFYTECFNDELYNWNDHLKPPLTYQDFIESNPVFIVKDPFGRFLQLTRNDYILPPACEPVIYIYSDSQKEYQIKLDPKIKPLSTYPHHDVTEGWRAKGSNNGSVTLSRNGRKYKYLFWEGSSVYLPPITDGFIVHADSLNVFFLETLKRLGLNDNEMKDFTEYWVPQFDQPDVYYRISFYSQALIDQLFPLEITPTPKQVIRILMDYEVVGKDRIDLATPTIVSVDRIADELIVEWGGINRPPKLSMN